MFHRDITLPPPFARIELFGLAETITADCGKTQMVWSLYMVDPFAEGGRTLLRRYPWFRTTTALCAGRE